MWSKCSSKIDCQSLHGKAAIDSQVQGKRCCLQQAAASGTSQQPAQVHCLVLLPGCRVSPAGAASGRASAAHWEACGAFGAHNRSFEAALAEGFRA
ncbi:MAG: hypothetical protein CMM05_07385 [Rhodopirellula sp.]|nr:hypothetical protein [Rhodopirellula sp.]